MLRSVSGRNVNTIYPQIVDLMKREAVAADSRNGGVTVLDGPFCAVYERPDEMVLLDPARGANPFFHLIECLWHLGAREDAGLLNNYVGDFGKRFANEDGNLDGAYGVRWRRHFYTKVQKSASKEDWLPIDQLDLAVEKLRANPLDRRVVIQMWDPVKDNNPDTRDACCNQQLFPRIVDGRLDLTVTCRSNDAVWGALGANCVHFPFLQLYLAGRIGVEVGRFYQFSNNYHLYDAIRKKVGSPRPAVLDPYTRGEVTSYPIGTDFDRWDDDLGAFLAWHDKVWSDRESWITTYPRYTNLWFSDVAENMVRAFWCYRAGRPEEAQLAAGMVKASDWRAGALLWLDQAAIRAASRAQKDDVSRDVRAG